MPEGDLSGWYKTGGLLGSGRARLSSWHKTGCVGAVRVLFFLIVFGSIPNDKKSCRLHLVKKKIGKKQNKVYVIYPM